jgi:phosphoserine phosphatase
MSLSPRERIRPDEVVFVGDGENDHFVLGAVGLTIAFMPKAEKIHDEADVRIYSPDISRILPHVIARADSTAVHAS